MRQGEEDAKGGQKEEDTSREDRGVRHRDRGDGRGQGATRTHERRKAQGNMKREEEEKKMCPKKYTGLVITEASR